MPDDGRRRQMKEAVRQIVVTRERTPRSPRWAAAWRRALLRYVSELEASEPERSQTVVPTWDHPECR